MNGLLSRRQVLMTCILAALPGQAAWAFDRVGAGERYRQWLKQLKSDLQAVTREVPADEPITVDHINKLCASSVVPDSRAAANFRDWLNESRKYGERTVSGEIVFVGPLTIIMRLLESSIPAGQGGLYPEPAGSSFPDRALSVWYMHVHGGEHLQRYFDNSEVFKPYHLPPDGQLERGAYPFLMFEDKDQRLRFGGVGREWYGAVGWLYEMQFH